MGHLILFALIASLGIFVQSLFGFAGSLTAIPLFALFFAPREAVPAYNLVMLVMDVWLVFEARSHIQWSRVTRLLAGAFCGIPIGAYALKYLPTAVMSAGISVVTCLFCIMYLLKIRPALRENTSTQLGVGFVSGILHGSISQSGPPVIMYVLMRDWGKDTSRATLLSYFLCLCSMTLVVYGRMGLITQRSVLSASTALVPAFAASLAGIALKRRISEGSFRVIS